MSSAPVIFAAVPTLFGPGGELDLDANRALHKFVAGLVDGLFVAGTTGEFPALEDAERLSLIELALAEAGSDRVIAHIGAPDARHAGRLAQAAVALGATRIAAITPYFLLARPDELIAHYRAIRDAASGPEFYAYIFPERTGLPVSPTLFARVAEAAGTRPAVLFRRRREPGRHDAGRRRGRGSPGAARLTPRSTRPCSTSRGHRRPRRRLTGLSPWERAWDG